MKKSISNIFCRKSDRALALIAENICRLHEEGIDLLSIMDLLLELPLPRKYLDSIKDTKSSIAQGNTLAESLKVNNTIYPEFFISMIDMGEKSGKLSTILKCLEQYYKKINSIKKTIANALSYPFIIIIAMFLLLIFLALFIIPSFYDVYMSSGSEIPRSCLFIYKFVEFFKENKFIGITYIFCWGIILPSVIFKLIYNLYLKERLLKIPIVKKFNEYIFVSLLSIITNSGVNLSNGLNYCTNSFKSKIIKNKFLMINKKILQGNSLGDSLIDIGGYSKYTIAVIKLGEMGGSMDERLKNLSIYLENEINLYITKWINLIQPMTILCMAGIVLIFIVIFVLPLFDSLLGGIG
ncbi:type II secretion system F family protein [Clostridium chauvoei]|uniref:Type II secretion system F family protein n=2 Tax=Clostridium chauvoei TaxID=46867 RepID=A0ABD4RE33_9CLOT|nr:type II secretion system F family protein [Clostridium chauvoei]ATD55209.1 hypothetical protein BTM20_08130 [Clostridium chauvoei]MBX7279553.1 type II secretion system F family protein [Clostridium chauvoei]MBX7281922.1 type II secretion system F family protein [Clostridium chauvoei]MBX7284489.1 type II secretion system F family protein [Clostridium chauvoei]MBX7289642.1 type II secretion system F family protein [Clostridium chauvoei]